MARTKVTDNLVKIGEVMNRPVYRNAQGERVMVFGVGFGLFATQTVWRIEPGWRPVSLVLWGDNSTDVVLENRAGEKKTVQAVPPHGD